jgi:SAM-dependent methyltransferase
VTPSAVIWHDVEHGSYDADLSLWRELAGDADGPILDLGAGTGRVAADLAASGHEVVALDTDPELLDSLAERAPGVKTVTADARDFDLATTFGLVIAPMQLVHILGGRDGRLAMLRRVHAHLEEGGTFAAALVDPGDAFPDGDAGAAAEAVPPLPDMLESDGWVFSSQPLSVQERNGRVLVTRRRQTVSPVGEREEELVEIALDVVSVDEFRGELEATGFSGIERRRVPETADHVGSTVVLCRR